MGNNYSSIVKIHKMVSKFKVACLGLLSVMSSYIFGACATANHNRINTSEEILINQLLGIENSAMRGDMMGYKTSKAIREGLLKAAAGLYAGTVKLDLVEQNGYVTGCQAEGDYSELKDPYSALDSAFKNADKNKDKIILKQEALDLLEELCKSAVELKYSPARIQKEKERLGKQ